MEVKQIVKYVATDGREFGDHGHAVAHNELIELEAEYDSELHTEALYGNDSQCHRVDFGELAEWLHENEDFVERVIGAKTRSEP